MDEQTVRADAEAVLAFLEGVNDEHAYGIVDDETLAQMQRVAAALASAPEPEHGQLEDAIRVLARMVREEYPERYSLSGIAAIWGGATPAELAALFAIERQWGVLPNVSQEAAE